jgi:L-arabinose isomerase
MFCPDWEGGSVFLSHMGEINPNVCAEKPKLTCSPMPWIEVNAPVMAVGRFKPGCVTLVNLAPGPNGAFTLIVAPGQMLSYEGEDRFTNSVRGWFKPDMGLTDFLEEYSRLGGTHHSALVYFSFTEDLMRFADIMEWDCAVLGE